MRDSFIAVDAATDLRAHARNLRQWWDATFTGAPVRGQVRPVIARSWSRMTGAGLHPAHLRPRPALDADALAAARSSSPLRHALPALRHHLGGIAEEAQHIVVVCDAVGGILWLEGHPRVVEGAEGITFRPGMLWTEDSAGTNAIGTALAIQHPVQIFSAEHFLVEQHLWWCSAAPLHDPTTGQLLGVVDVSGPVWTAHPYSLTLVTAAARIAGDVLHARHLAQDNGLRASYLERVRRSRGGASALVDAQGRVLLALPGAWLSGTVVPPAAPGRTRLVAGPEVEAEPLGAQAWVLWKIDDGRPGRPPARPARVDLRVLGRHGHTVSIDGAPPHELSLRQAEALVLLALYPDGLSAEQLTLHLYGDAGKPVTTRALMSRLRSLLGGCLRARPYRLAADVHADVLEVSALLEAGEPTRALARYRGPLLLESDVVRITELRDELAAALRRAALAGSPDVMWAWLGTEHGREDPDAMEAFLAVAATDDPRRDAIAARLRGLLHRWDEDAL
jgi:hypothetical protein